MPSVRSFPEATQKAKTKHLFLPYVPTAVKTAENMAALNVDCITWIITVLGAINSNHTFIFELIFFSVKVKNFEETNDKFLARNKHEVFLFKTTPIPRRPVQEAKSNLKILFTNA